MADMNTDFERQAREGKLRDRYGMYLTFSTDQYILSFEDWLDAGEPQ